MTIIMITIMVMIYLSPPPSLSLSLSVSVSLGSQGLLRIDEIAPGYRVINSNNFTVGIRVFFDRLKIILVRAIFVVALAPQ